MGWIAPDRPTASEALRSFVRLPGKSSSVRWQSLVRLWYFCGPLGICADFPLLTGQEAASSM